MLLWPRTAIELPFVFALTEQRDITLTWGPHLRG